MSENIHIECFMEARKGEQKSLFLSIAIACACLSISLNPDINIVQDPMLNLSLKLPHATYLLLFMYVCSGLWLLHQSYYVQKNISSLTKQSLKALTCAPYILNISSRLRIIPILGPVFILFSAFLLGSSYSAFICFCFSLFLSIFHLVSITANNMKNNNFEKS